MSDTFSRASAEIAGAARLWRVWVALAAEDIGDQHRRTTLGPFWNLVNYLAFAGTFVFLFSVEGSNDNYGPYVAVGLLVYFYISDIIGSGVSIFVREESFIKGTTLPVTIYVMRLTMQSIIRGGYEVAGCLALLFLFGHDASLTWAWAGLGIILIVATAPAAITVFGFLGAYFPDAQFLVGNALRLMMFLSPVMWVHGGEGGVRGAFYYYNPITYYLEIVRDPIVNGVFPTHAFAITAIISALLWILAVFLLGKLRRQLVFFL